MDHVRALTRDIGPRPFDSAASTRAAEYIAEQLRGMGAEPKLARVGPIDLPAVAVGPLRFFERRRLTIQDVNIWVELRDPNQADQPALLVMAHYDTVYRSPGAVDNAASVGVALELVRALRERPGPRPVIVAFTAAEEIRLAGAHALARLLSPRVGLAVSMDLIGGPGTLTINGASQLLGAAWLRYLADTAERAGIDIEVPLPHRVVSRLLPQIERSDHGVFTRLGVPALHLYHRGPGALYLPYHTALDTSDRVSSTSVANAVTFVEALARASDGFPRSGGDQGFWVPGANWVMPGWLLWSLELCAIAWLAFALWHLGRRRSQQRGLGLIMVGLLYASSWAFVALVLWLQSGGADHPRPWVHDPGLHVALSSLLAALLCTGLLVAYTSRHALAGVHRYLMASLAMYGLTGVALMALGAPELAWGPLFMAVCCSAMARVRSLPLAGLLLALACLPLLGPLHPAFLREAVFNGFFRQELPLPLFLALMWAPTACAAVYLAKRSERTLRPMPLLIAALSLVVVLATIILWQEPGCSGASFTRYNLTCELPELAPR